jgi:hypothetical protein
MSKAHVTHPELKATFSLDILGVKKNPNGQMYSSLGVITKGEGRGGAGAVCCSSAAVRCGGKKVGLGHGCVTVTALHGGWGGGGGAGGGGSAAGSSWLRSGPSLLKQRMAWLAVVVDDTNSSPTPPPLH